MIILGIETSCDETALSIIEVSGDTAQPHFSVLGNTVLSQIKLHEQYGGVFPMLAKREHAKNLVPLLMKLLEGTELIKETQTTLTPELEAAISGTLEKEPELKELLMPFLASHEKPSIDAIAVTEGPGLEPALWVGINFAKCLGIAWNLPVVPVNHMEGHIVASLLKDESFDDKKSHPLKPLPLPALALLISGGHTELIHIKNFREYRILGQTRDDAVGEAFDKAARILGLPYPGGPQISRLAETERAAQRIIPPQYKLPRPMIHTDNYDFSFAGLKTAVLYMVQKIKEITPEIKAAIAHEFENAVTEVLISKTKKAIERESAGALIVGGGVVANTHIRSAFESLTKEMNIPLLLPKTDLSTDNALMIAIAGGLMYMEKKDGWIQPEIKARGNLKLS
jgi:N6-L-threonylcarbamoyladenine synthase